jgi:hypothetical protein
MQFGKDRTIIDSLERLRVWCQPIKNDEQPQKKVKMSLYRQ